MLNKSTISVFVDSSRRNMSRKSRTLSRAGSISQVELDEQRDRIKHTLLASTYGIPITQENVANNFIIIENGEAYSLRAILRFWGNL